MRKLGLVALTGAVLVGCGAGGNPGLLSTTCAEFLKADEQKQMDVAAQWANPARDGSVTDQSKFMAFGARAGIGRYCQEDGHDDPEIGDLEVSGG